MHQVRAGPAEHGHREGGRGAFGIDKNSCVAFRDRALQLFQKSALVCLVVTRGEPHGVRGVLRNGSKCCSGGLFSARPPAHAISNDAEVQAHFTGEVAELGGGHTRGVHLHSLVQACDQELILIYPPHVARMRQAENVDVACEGPVCNRWRCCDGHGALLPDIRVH